MSKVCLSILLSVIFFVAVFGWEGEWSYNDRESVYLCQEGDWIHGTYGHMGSIQMKISASNPMMASGKYFGAGHKFGGYRVGKSPRQYTRSQGKVTMTMSDNMKSISMEFWRKGKGAREEFGKTVMVSSTRISKTVTDRIVSCGIIDTSSKDMIDGSWVSSSSGLAVEACTDMSDWSFTASFAMPGENDTTNHWIGWGDCTWNGQVCHLDFFTKSMWKFGTMVLIKLSDGTVSSMWWLGTTPQTVDIDAMPTWHGDDVLSSATESGMMNCSAAMDEYYNPTKCAMMTNEACMTQEKFGICYFSEEKAHNSTGWSCYVKKKME